MAFLQPYKKSRKIGAADEDSNLEVSLGNEVPLFDVDITIANAAAIAARLVIPSSGLAYKISRVATRATTSVAGTTGGVNAELVISRAAEGTAVASKTTVVSLPLTTTTVGTDTTTTKEHIPTANYLLNPGDYVDINSIQGTHTGAAGVVHATIYAHEMPVI